MHSRQGVFGCQVPNVTITSPLHNLPLHTLVQGLQHIDEIGELFENGHLLSIRPGRIVRDCESEAEDGASWFFKVHRSWVKVLHFAIGKEFRAASTHVRLILSLLTGDLEMG